MSGEKKLNFFYGTSNQYIYIYIYREQNNLKKRLSTHNNSIVEDFEK